jgi:hypothetical protein
MPKYLKESHLSSRGKLKDIFYFGRFPRIDVPNVYAAFLSVDLAPRGFHEDIQDRHETIGDDSLCPSH